MTALQTLIICLSGIVAVFGVATIFGGAYIKGNRLDKFEDDLKEVKENFRKEINKVWDEVSKVNVLESKIEGLEKRMDEILDLLRNMKRDKG